MMRVLSLSTLFPSPVRPAFGKFVANQMRAVAERGGVELVMVNPIGVPPWPLALREPYRSYAGCPAESELDGVRIYHPRFTLIPVVGADSNPARIAAAVLPLVRRLHAEQPFALVDAQFFCPDGPAAALIAHELGLPLTIKARGSDIHYWRGRPKALAQILSAAGKASALLTVSAALGRDMAALGMAEGKIHTHYTGLDHGRFRVMPRAEARVGLDLSLPEGAPLVVCPGALIAIKGQSLAIGALAELPEVHLALAGSGPDEVALRAQVEALGLSERVHFMGQVSHDVLPLLMSAAAAVVLPSEREGLANVWVEALACGAPLVIPDIGGAREVVRDASAGRIVERDSRAIAGALRELIGSPEDQSVVAANAAGFSWQANAEKLVGIWREAAQA
jgi:teichuronic acid biosynthesis glycosyltransferase TuaC